MRYTILRRLATFFVPEPAYLKKMSGQIYHTRNKLYRNLKKKFRYVPVSELQLMLHQHLAGRG